MIANGFEMCLHNLLQDNYCIEMECYISLEDQQLKHCNIMWNINMNDSKMVMPTIALT